MMNLYPEQLRQIAAMCEGLNASEMLPDNPDHGIQFKYGIPLVTSEGDPVGTLVDEVGGEWSFEPWVKEDDK